MRALEAAQHQLDTANIDLAIMALAAVAAAVIVALLFGVDLVDVIIDENFLRQV